MRRELELGTWHDFFYSFGFAAWLWMMDGKGDVIDAAYCVGTVQNLLVTSDTKYFNKYVVIL